MTIHILSDRGLPLSLSGGSFARSGFVQQVSAIVGIRNTDVSNRCSRRDPLRNQFAYLVDAIEIGAVAALASLRITSFQAEIVDKGVDARPEPSWRC